jgi:predicted AAA+ superfamily ATPase
MATPSRSPTLDPDETAALEQLDRIEAVARAKSMPRVVERMRELAERLGGERNPEARRQMREVLDRIHSAAEATGLPPLTLDEINDEVSAVRAEKRTGTPVGR